MEVKVVRVLDGSAVGEGDEDYGYSEDEVFMGCKMAVDRLEGGMGEVGEGGFRSDWAWLVVANAIIAGEKKVRFTTKTYSLQKIIKETNKELVNYCIKITK